MASLPYLIDEKPSVTKPLRSESPEACTSDGRFTLRDFPVRKRSAKAHKTTHYKSEYESESGAVKLRQYPAFAAAKRAGRIVRRRERLRVNIAALRSGASKLIRQIGLTRFDWEPFRPAVRRSPINDPDRGQATREKLEEQMFGVPFWKASVRRTPLGIRGLFQPAFAEHASMSRLALSLCDAPT